MSLSPRSNSSKEIKEDEAKGTKGIVLAPRQLVLPSVPSIAPLDLLNQVINSINAEIVHLDVELLSALAEQKENSPIVAAIKEISVNVHEILQKSVQTQSILDSLSKEENSQKLIQINNRLKPTADILTRLEKLDEKLSELHDEIVNGEYDYYNIIANLIVSIQKEFEEFDCYRAIPQMVSIHNKFTSLKDELSRQIQWKFRELGQLVPSHDSIDAANGGVSVDISPLVQAYRTVDAMGSKFRVDLIERFAQLQLLPYEKLFAPPSSLSSFDNLTARFAWFTRLLDVVRNTLESKPEQTQPNFVFPSYWVVPFYLFMEFSRRSKKHFRKLLEELEQQKPDLKQHVQILTGALTQIAKFEASIKATFQESIRGIDEEENIMMEYGETMADAFDEFLGPYVQAEREELERLLQRLDEEERRGEYGEGEKLNPGDPFPSSRKIFESIKKSLSRCTKYSTGRAYLVLSCEYRNTLQKYAQSLKFRCPSPKYTEPNKPLEYEIHPQDEDTMARVIITADYCSETIPLLEESMKKHIRVELREKIDFSGQIDVFQDVATFTINILVQNLVEKSRDCWRLMRDSVWNLRDDAGVGDESKYVKQLIALYTKAIPRMRNLLSPTYFQVFCMKLVTQTYNLYLEYVWKLRGVSPTGSGQLLMDLSGIKEFFLRIRNVRLEAGRDELPIQEAFKAIVNSKNSVIQTIFKLVCTDDNQLEHTFAVLWPEGKPEDLKRVREIKATVLNEIFDPAKRVASSTGKVLTNVSTTVIGKQGTDTITGTLKAGKDVVKTGTSGIKSGVGTFFGDVKSIFSTGDMFGGDTTHHGTSSHGSTHGPSSSHGPMAQPKPGASKPK